MKSIFSREKHCRIIKSKHVLEVFFYDRIPEGKKKLVEEEEDKWDGKGFPDKFIGEYYFEDGVEKYKVTPFWHRDFLPDGWWGESERKRKEKEKELRQPGYRKSANYRSREKIRRLAIMNFKEGDLFMTLTFGENMQDLKFANDELKKFFKRFRYKFGAEIPYLGVIEFQKRGAIHYHILVGMDLGIDFEDREVREAKEREIGEMWGHGWVDLAQIDRTDNLGAYLVKYLSKDLGDDRLSGHKHYLCSKGLDHPETIKDTTVYLDSLEGHYPTFTSEYRNDFCGNIKYMEFNIERGMQRVQSDD